MNSVAYFGRLQGVDKSAIQSSSVRDAFLLLHRFDLLSESNCIQVFNLDSLNQLNVDTQPDPGLGIWRSNSYTDGGFLFAFALNRPIGADLEKIRISESKPPISPMFFTPDEIRSILEKENQRCSWVLFFRIFSMKEAIGKCFGVGLVSESYTHTRFTEVFCFIDIFQPYIAFEVSGLYLRSIITPDDFVLSFCERVL